MITLDGMVFSEFATDGWVYSELTDWYGQVGNKVQRTKRPLRHGNFQETRVFRDGRAVSFKAAYLSDSAGAVQSAVDELSSVGADGPVVMTVVGDDGFPAYRVVTVELVGVPDWLSATEAEVTVMLIADDPRRYADGAWQQTGPAVQSGGLVWPAVWPLVWPVSGSSGRVTLPNPGKAPSPAVFRLLGPFDSALITCVESGARVGFNRPVPAGSVVEVSGRRAVIDGQSDVSRWLQFREWTDVPGGESRTFQFDPVGGAAAFMQGKVDPAWW